MKKPEALVALIEELHEEGPRSDVQVHRGSKVTIYRDAQAVDEEDGIVLSGQEAVLVLASKENVDRLLEALGEPEEASISFSDVTVNHEVTDYVERRFVAVDEE